MGRLRKDTRSLYRRAKGGRRKLDVTSPARPHRTGQGGSGGRVVSMGRLQIGNAEYNVVFITIL